MSAFDGLFNKIIKEQASAPNPVSYGQVKPESDEDAEAYVSGMNFDAFLEKLISILGGKQDLHSKLRIVSKMAFDAKRDQENRNEDAENEGDAEEGELMTSMKQKGMIPMESKPRTIFSGTREKR